MKKAGAIWLGLAALVAAWSWCSPPPSRIVAPDQTVSGLAIDGRWVVWTQRGPRDEGGTTTGELRRTSAEGGGPVETLVVGLRGVGPVAVQGGRIYWLDLDGVRRCNRDGSDLRTLAAIPFWYPDLAVEGGEVLVSSLARRWATAIWAVPTAGGKPRRIATVEGIVSGLAASRQHVYATLAMQDHEHRGARLVRIGRAGGLPEELLADEPGPVRFSGPAVDDGAVTFVRAPFGAPAELRRLVPGKPPGVVLWRGPGPIRPALWGRRLAWLGAAGVWTLKLPSGTPERRHVADLSGVLQMAFDGRRLFWAERLHEGKGPIVRLDVR